MYPIMLRSNRISKFTFVFQYSDQAISLPILLRFDGSMLILYDIKVHMYAYALHLKLQTYRFLHPASSSE